MYIIETEKFTDTFVSIRTILPLKKETITAMNLLLIMMRSRTKKYPTKDALSNALSRAYDMQASSGLAGYGKCLVLNTKFQFIRPDWIEEAGFKDRILDIMDQLLHQIVLEEDLLEEAKFLLENRIDRVMDDPDYLAINTALSLAAPDHNLSISMNGYKEDIADITLDKIKDLYEMVCKAPKYVYMCGKIVPEIKAYLEKIDTKGKIQSNYELIPAIDCKEKILTKDISQTSISMIYATGIDFKSDLYYPLLMANSIFGQNAMSLLFQTVREKYSYCYNISSGLLRFDGAMMVSVGTQRENVEKVIELTDKQLELLVSGDWDDDLLDIAKKDLIDSLTTQQDYPASMIEQEFLDAMLERQTTPEERLEAIRSVTKEQVCAAASRWKKVSCAIVQEEDNEV